MAEKENLLEHIVTWAEVQRDTKLLVNRLIDAGPWRGIVGISRGGLVPATILAREMEIRYVDTICIASYDEKDQSKITLIKSPAEAVADAGKGWLLVDDLVDTGATTTVLSAADAGRVGIDVDALNFAIPVSTANGIARAARATVDEVRVGSISRSRLPVLVAAPGTLSQSLLGMNFIGSLSGFDVRRDLLILRD